MYLSTCHRDDVHRCVQEPETGPMGFHSEPVAFSRERLLDALETHDFYFGPSSGEHITLRGPNYPGTMVHDLDSETVSMLLVHPKNETGPGGFGHKS